jgi:hypothetical protein
MKLSQSPYALHVCQLDFGFDEFSSTTSNTALLYIEDLSGCLSSLLVKFPNLTALELMNLPRRSHKIREESIWTLLLLCYVMYRFQT